MSDPRISRKTCHLPTSAIAGLLAGLLLVSPLSTGADELSDPGTWHGEWQAQDTDFTLLVLPSGTNFRLEPLRPAGIEWQAGEGLINGSSGTVEVRYQGVVAQVMVQLTSPETAIVRSMSCQPDYHVVCTLVRNQQARFIKIQ